MLVGGGELCNKEKRMHIAGMAAHVGRWGNLCVCVCVHVRVCVCVMAADEDVSIL